MTLYLHEMKRGRLALIIWSATVSFLIGVCVLIYPEMKTQMAEMSDMFASMGALSDAFGMTELNFGEFIAYFATEFSNTVLLGGALFAAITASASLAGEERDGTAEFLLTHPISRTEILVSKLLSVISRVVIFNLAVAFTTVLCMLAVSESADAKTMLLMFLSGTLMQLEIALISFAVSAFMRRGTLAAGLGIAMLLYFMNIVANLTEELEFLKYITPFGYSDSAKILKDGTLNSAYLLIGALITAAAAILSFVKYNKKDIS